jgi:hypothetical protein
MNLRKDEINDGSFAVVLHTDSQDTLLDECKDMCQCVSDNVRLLVQVEGRLGRLVIQGGFLCSV